jgi:hypothetical protein
MDTIKVSRAKLIDKLISNRSRHVKTYEAARVGFKRKLIERLKVMLSKAKAGKFNDALHTNLSVPVSHEKEYTRRIDMLRMSVEREVEITESEYVMYVEDKWTWERDAFVNATYAKAATIARRKR